VTVVASVAAGDVLPPVVHVTTRAQLVRYAGAARDFSASHYDDRYARERGFPSVIVHGFLKAGLLADLALDWAGSGSWFRTFGARYRGIDLVGHPLVCRGVVLAVPTPDRVEVELWTESDQGERTTTATGTIQLGGGA